MYSYLFPVSSRFSPGRLNDSRHLFTHMLMHVHSLEQCWTAFSCWVTDLGSGHVLAEHSAWDHQDHNQWCLVGLVGYWRSSLRPDASKAFTTPFWASFLALHIVFFCLFVFYKLSNMLACSSTYNLTIIHCNPLRFFVLVLFYFLSFLLCFVLGSYLVMLRGFIPGSSLRNYSWWYSQDQMRCPRLNLNRVHARQVPFLLSYLSSLSPLYLLMNLVKALMIFVHFFQRTCS